MENQATRPSEQRKCLHVLTRNACNSELDYTFINSAVQCCCEHLQFSLRQPNSQKCSSLPAPALTKMAPAKLSWFQLSLCMGTTLISGPVLVIYDWGLKLNLCSQMGWLSTRLLLTLESDVIQLCINYLARENRELERELVWSPGLKTVYLAVQLGIAWKAEGKRNITWIANKCILNVLTRIWRVQACSPDWQPKHRGKTIPAFLPFLLCCVMYGTGLKETELIPRCFIPCGICTCPAISLLKKIKIKSYHAKSEFK